MTAFFARFRERLKRARRGCFAPPTAEGAFFAVTLAVAVAVFLSGCSTGKDYWQNRWDDACDIVTAGIGGGFGAKAYVFGLQVDLYNYSPLAEVRGGEAFVFHKHSEEYHVEEGNIGVPLLGANSEIFYPGGRSVKRGKAYCGSTPLLPFFILDTEKNSKDYCNTCAWHSKSAFNRKYENRQMSQEEWAKLRRQFYAEFGESPKFGGKKNLEFDRPAWCVYTDVNLVAAIGFGFRLGFNVGEFADFLLGWCGVDILKDDL